MAPLVIDLLAFIAIPLADALAALEPAFVFILYGVDLPFPIGGKVLFLRHGLLPIAAADIELAGA